MKQILSLDGEWRAFQRGTEAHFEFKGTVPGCVHTDLISAGIIKDLYYRDNATLYQYVENNDYTYEKSFTLEDIPENAYLEFDGLDTYCEVYLNGRLLGKCEDMFTPFAFPVSDCLTKGKNKVSVCFRSPIKETYGRPKRSAAFTCERLYTRRIQCTYGWDWVDRFVTMGIYRSVRLVSRTANDIDSFYLYTASVLDESAQLNLKVNFRDFKESDDKMTVEILSPSGQSVFKKSLSVISPVRKLRIDLPSPKLWYPSGYGEQPLYTLSLTTAECQITHRFGIRVVTITQIEDAADSDYAKKAREIKKLPFYERYEKSDASSGFIISVNGKRIMCKGANFVPTEPFPSAENPEKITSLLTLSRNAGVNMVRVWGGGMPASDHFYNECTRLGIMVTQDFFMACGDYPENEEWFIEALAKEAEATAKRLRNHTSLIYWSGDNENATEGNENTTDFTGYRSATLGLEPTVERLDPNRVFLPSSPYGGDKYASATCGTTHISNFLFDIYNHTLDSDLSDFNEFMNSFEARFIAEQPTMGMPFLSCLRKFMSEEDIFGEDCRISEFHTKHNPELGKVTIYSFIDTMARKVFGEYKDGYDRLYKMQMIQCEWVRISIELARRNQWFSSGIIYWMLNDCWPAANGWSLIDYYNSPKPALYSFMRGASSPITSIKRDGDEYVVYLCNDTERDITVTGEFYIYDFAENTSVFSESFESTAPASSAAEALRIKADIPDSMLNGNRILLCDIKHSEGWDRAHFTAKKYSELNIPYGKPTVTEEADGYITVTADSFNPFVILDTPYLLERNCFPIKQGEKIQLKILGRL